MRGAISEIVAPSCIVTETRVQEYGPGAQNCLCNNGLSTSPLDVSSKTSMRSFSWSGAFAAGMFPVIATKPAVCNADQDGSMATSVASSGLTNTGEVASKQPVNRSRNPVVKWRPVIVGTSRSEA